MSIRKFAGRAPTAVADIKEQEEGEAVPPDWDELNKMLPQVPQDLIDKANRAAELDQIAQQGKQDLANLNESLTALSRPHAAPPTGIRRLFRPDRGQHGRAGSPRPRTVATRVTCGYAISCSAVVLLR